MKISYDLDGKITGYARLGGIDGNFITVASIPDRVVDYYTVVDGQLVEKTEAEKAEIDAIRLKKRSVSHEDSITELLESFLAIGCPYLGFHIIASPHGRANLSQMVSHSSAITFPTNIRSYEGDYITIANSNDLGNIEDLMFAFIQETFTEAWGYMDQLLTALTSEAMDTIVDNYRTATGQ